MQKFKNLLVVIDPTSEHQIALERAIELSQKNNSKMTIFHSVFDLSYEMTSILSIEERDAMRNGVLDQRRAWLDDLVESYSTDGIEISKRVIWHNRPFESIIELAIEEDFDVIIKGTHEHDKLKSVIFTPTDWHLMRKAPEPVLLVKAKNWFSGGKILCAINLEEDDNHRHLSHSIIEHAQFIAKQFNGEVHLVNAYPGTPVNIAIELPDFDMINYNESMREQHHNELIKVAEQFNIAKEHCHVLEGLPEDVIPELTEELSAELVILGTIGRTGISAALIGNTAEHVIDNINCDLLTLKPDGFVSPISPK
ncbi:universal stress protein UspE [Parashewanella curva]|uniref:Universal stress protein UspE n=1 Tax=Parashewanella curva TaxID=2338552 RepID=A0A3L8PRY9_9GAMM|nr:universal stress protein UspE [Parashewanella curva]RLV58187.1 universal stress protein UspE [Parashewanella curva]